MEDLDVTTAVVAWARAVLPEVNEGFSYEPGVKGDLPDVIATLDTTGVQVGQAQFPFSQIQQAFVVVRALTISFMVDDSDPAAADTQLKNFAGRLLRSALKDGTLGGRVPFISRLMTFDYTNPFVEYTDGTRGREMTMSITVGELVEAE